MPEKVTVKSFSYDDHQSSFVSGSFCGVYHCLLYQLFGFRTTVACSSFRDCRLVLPLEFFPVCISWGIDY
ncbi:hypothetical protein LINPERHAP2_LOCUS36814 [Linum perenne]